MDRFIGVNSRKLSLADLYLKSNMDRFIGLDFSEPHTLMY